MSEKTVCICIWIKTQRGGKRDGKCVCERERRERETLALLAFKCLLVSSAPFKVVSSSYI